MEGKEFYNEDYKPQLDKVEQIQRTIVKALNEYDNTLVYHNKIQIGLRIAELKSELAVERDKLEYHKLRIFPEIAKGYIDKETYLKIWEEVNKIIPIVETKTKLIRKKFKNR